MPPSGRKRKSDDDDTSPSSQPKRKRKMTIHTKVQILRKLEKGTPINDLAKQYGVSSSTVYYIKKHSNEILTFAFRSKARETLKYLKVMVNRTELDDELVKWCRQQRKEGISITGRMVMRQARIIHNQLNLMHKCDYSRAWFDSFKCRNSVLFDDSDDEGVDVFGPEKCVDKLVELAATDNNLVPFVTCTMDEEKLLLMPGDDDMAKDPLDGL